MKKGLFWSVVFLCVSAYKVQGQVSISHVKMLEYKDPVFRHSGLWNDTIYAGTATELSKFDLDGRLLESIRSNDFQFIDFLVDANGMIILNQSTGASYFNHRGKAYSISDSLNGERVVQDFIWSGRHFYLLKSGMLVEAGKGFTRLKAIAGYSVNGLKSVNNYAGGICFQWHKGLLVWKASDSSFTYHQVDKDIPLVDYIENAYMDASGRLWVHNLGRIAVLNNGQWELYAYGADPVSFFLDAQGNMLIRGDGGFYRVDSGNFKAPGFVEAELPSGWNYKGVTMLYENDYKLVWDGKAYHSELLYNEAPEWSSWPGGDTASMVGNKVMFRNSRAYYFIDPVDKEWSAPVDYRLIGGNFYGKKAYQDEGIPLCLRGQKVYARINGRLQEYYEGSKGPAGKYLELITDERGGVWLYTSKGVYNFESDFVGPDFGTEIGGVGLMALHSKGNVAIYDVGKNVYLSRNNTWDTLCCLTNKRVISMHFTQAGELLVSTLDGINVYGQSGSLLKTIEKASAELMAGVDGDNFWALQEGRLFFYEKGQMINMNDSLQYSFNKATNLLVQNQRAVWVLDKEGLHYVERPKPTFVQPPVSKKIPFRIVGNQILIEQEGIHGLHLYNMSGQLLLRVDGVNPDISSLTAGMYYMVISFEDGRKSAYKFFR